MIWITMLCAAFALDTSRPNADGPGAPSGPTAVSAPALRSLDFVQGEGRTDVVIGTLGAATHTVSADDGVLVVSLPGVAVPRSLQRPLDTRFFHAFIDAVHAAPTHNGAAVTIQLRASVAHEVIAEGDGFLTIRFAQPVAEEATAPGA